jgi:hypothetical protein
MVAFERGFATVVGVVGACAASAQGDHPVRLKHRNETDRPRGSLKEVRKSDPFRPGKP